MRYFKITNDCNTTQYIKSELDSFPLLKDSSCILEEISESIFDYETTFKTNKLDLFMPIDSDEANSINGFIPYK